MDRERGHLPENAGGKIAVPADRRSQRASFAASARGVSEPAMPDADAKTVYRAEVRKLDTWPETLFDEAAFRREQTQLARVWTFLGHTWDVAKDGDWFRATIATRSVFVQRFGDELRGFENRCVHRSYPLRTKDKGNGAIRCGFHHWRYDADGRAVEIPQCEQLFGTTPQEMGARLNRVQIATCGALIFGRFQALGDNETLEDYLGEAFPIFQAMWPPAVKPQFLTGPVKANWRLCFQIAVEDYHVVAVHKGMFGKDGYRLFPLEPAQRFLHDARARRLCENGGRVPGGHLAVGQLPRVSHLPQPDDLALPDRRPALACDGNAIFRRRHRPDTDAGVVQPRAVSARPAASLVRADRRAPQGRGSPGHRAVLL
jgi:nitrite reductase/ring-hydroxylating ferredoxin subunit